MITEETIERFEHPALRESVRAVNLPEVQEMIRKLGQYGLAVALPHMHQEGKMVPLPEDMCAFEEKLKITFGKKDDESGVPMVPVMWQCGNEIDSVARCVQNCGGCC